MISAPLREHGVTVIDQAFHRDPARSRPLPPNPDLRVVAVAALLLAGGALALMGSFGWRQGSLYLLGGALGLVLYHATFGLASSWRRFITEGRGAGLRAQMVMLAVATAIFLPVLAKRERDTGESLHPRHDSTVAGRLKWMDRIGSDHGLVNPGAYFEELYGFDGIEAYESIRGPAKASFVIARRWSAGSAEVLVDVLGPAEFSKWAMLMKQNLDRGDDLFLYVHRTGSPIGRQILRLTPAQVESQVFFEMLPIG